MLYLYQFICTALIVFLIFYHWSRRNLYRFASKLPGPVPLPVIGNAYIFIGNTEDYLMKTMDLINIYGSVARFWLGPKLIATFTQPKHVSRILTSTKLTDKHEIYDIMKPILGEGLISGSGYLWKIGRKCIQPLFDVKFVLKAVTIAQNHINICIGNLQQHADAGDWFNVECAIHKCTIDVIGETILGRNFQAQFDRNQNFQQTITDMYNVIFPRMLKPWLHVDFLYNFTELKRQQDRIQTVIVEIFNQIIDDNSGAIDNGDGFTPAVVGIIEKYRKNSDKIDMKNLRDNLFTLYAASEDTVTAIASAACVCFGMYPNYQQQAIDEITNTIHDFNNITFDDVSKLVYLDMCVKDVLRLFPIAPFILRQCNEDFALDDMVIPKGCGVGIPIFNIHLNPEYWERPLEFYPDHFLPDATAQRNPFCYLPFSAGPRGCIGKLFAQTFIKLLLIYILKEYRIEAEGKYVDLYRKLRADISVRPIDGYKIRIRKRCR